MGNQKILEMMLVRTVVCVEEVNAERWQLLSSGSASKVDTVHAFDFAWNLINRLKYSIEEAIKQAKDFFEQAIFEDVQRMLETALA